MLLHSNIIGSGQPFVFLHGFLGTGDNWKTLGAQFASNGYQVHLLDQRNHGRSFHSDHFNYDIMVEDLKAYCDANQLETIVLLGHSMGGKTAMFFAMKYPERVSKLIVADIAPRYYPVHHETILKGLGALDFSQIKNRVEADEALKHYVRDIGTRQFLLKNLYWETKETLALRLNVKALKTNVEEIGEALPAHSKFLKDTLFLRGDKSEYIAIADEALIYSHFPKAQIVTIANAGHWLHAENPTDFYTEVLDFVKN